MGAVTIARSTLMAKHTIVRASEVDCSRQVFITAPVNVVCLAVAASEWPFPSAVSTGAATLAHAGTWVWVTYSGGVLGGVEVGGWEGEGEG